MNELKVIERVAPLTSPEEPDVAARLEELRLLRLVGWMEPERHSRRRDSIGTHRRLKRSTPPMCNGPICTPLPGETYWPSGHWVTTRVLWNSI